MYPPPPVPKAFFVAIVDFLGFKQHLSEHAGTQAAKGLTLLFERYFLMKWAAERVRRIDEIYLISQEEIEVANFELKSEIVSDTIMMWAEADRCAFLIRAAARLMNVALGFGVPLRGAVAYGECIFDDTNRIYLGYPIVEAVEAEKCQDWIGVGVLPSASAHLGNTGLFVEYKVPMKDNSRIPQIGHAVPWHWEEENPGAAEIYLLRGLDSAKECNHRTKYMNTLAFIRSTLNSANQV